MEPEHSPEIAPSCESQEPESVAPKQPKKPGRESKITVELVQRVSKRVGRGIPIQMALAGERVSWSAYKKHLQRHPDLAAIQEVAKIQFLDETFDMILSKPGPMLRWFLERRHPDLFAKPRDETPAAATATATATAPQTQTQTQNQNQNQTIAGVPQEALDEARRNFQAQYNQ